jgi:hypothetical protein
MITLVDGWGISSFGTWQTVASHGRIAYAYKVLTGLFAGLNCALGAPVAVGENPNNVLEYYLALRSENPSRDGDAMIAFGIVRKERVEVRIYDVAGRRVRTLAHREFAAGEHVLRWDGSGDDGRPVAHGVYFYVLRTPSFTSQKKIALLKR